MLADLAGPKIRIESFREGKVQLVEGAPFALDTALDPEAGTDDRGRLSPTRICRPTCMPAIRCCWPTARSCCEVDKVVGTRISSVVRSGGELSNRKGVNRQGGGISAPALTEKDLDDIRFAAELGIDYLAVSFARDADDIRRAQSELRKWRGEARVVAKIERHEALDNLAGILAVTDAVMVARGDLGVEMGYAELTGLQKTIIRQSLARNRVVITATQMMESMIQNPIPTRAEVSDVANAVLDGTDAVMLSAETAAGKFPVKAVQAMADVIRGAEKYQLGSPRAMAPRRRGVRQHRRGDRDGRDVHGQPHAGTRDRRADRIGHDAAVDVAHPLRYPGLCLHAPRGDAPARDAVSRRLRGAVRYRRTPRPRRCTARSSIACWNWGWSTSTTW